MVRWGHFQLQGEDIVVVVVVVVVGVVRRGIEHDDEFQVDAIVTVDEVVVLPKELPVVEVDVELEDVR